MLAKPSESTSPYLTMPDTRSVAFLPSDETVIGVAELVVLLGDGAGVDDDLLRALRATRRS